MKMVCPCGRLILPSLQHLCSGVRAALISGGGERNFSKNSEFASARGTYWPRPARSDCAMVPPQEFPPLSTPKTQLPARKLDLIHHDRWRCGRALNRAAFMQKWELRFWGLLKPGYFCVPQTPVIYPQLFQIA